MMNIDPTSFVSGSMRTSILSKLHKIEQDKNVRIIFAIESGSRAWGFPSPDSDYDVRFIYARPIDWYLTITPGRDVIELPIEGDYDINGWDIKKSLGLLLKPNPVMLEWLSSPIRYIWNDKQCEQLKKFSTNVSHGPACLHHYLHIGERQWNVYINGKTEVSLKKYFYIVRPAMAIRWMRMHPSIIPPMNFQELLTGIDLNENLEMALSQLLKAKRWSKEIGTAPRVTVIDNFITSEFSWAKKAIKTISPDKTNFYNDANTLFQDIINVSSS